MFCDLVGSTSLSAQLDPEDLREIIGGSGESQERGVVGETPNLAARLQGIVILTNGTPSTVALQRETSKIPIVFAQVTDPVGEGLVASLSRPGGNITGFSAYDSEMGGKWMELLKEFAPGVTRAALLFNPRTSPGGAPS